MRDIWAHRICCQCGCAWVADDADCPWCDRTALMGTEAIRGWAVPVPQLPPELLRQRWRTEWLNKGWPAWANTPEIRARLTDEMNLIPTHACEGGFYGCRNLSPDNWCDDCPLKPRYEPWP